MKGKLMGTKRELTYINEKSSCGNRKIGTYYLLEWLQRIITPNGLCVLNGNKNVKRQKEGREKKVPPRFELGLQDSES